MGRQMVGQRKAAVSADAGASADVATCPNCDCEFNATSGDVLHPGKPVEGGSSYEGADLDASGSQHPVPGPMGAAADAARGEQAIGNLLANLRGKV